MGNAQQQPVEERAGASLGGHLENILDNVILSKNNAREFRQWLDILEMDLRQHRFEGNARFAVFSLSVMNDYYQQKLLESDRELLEPRIEEVLEVAREIIPDSVIETMWRNGLQVQMKIKSPQQIIFEKGEQPENFVVVNHPLDAYWMRNVYSFNRQGKVIVDVPRSLAHPFALAVKSNRFYRKPISGEIVDIIARHGPWAIPWNRFVEKFPDYYRTRRRQIRGLTTSEWYQFPEKLQFVSKIQSVLKDMSYDDYLESTFLEDGELKIPDEKTVERMYPDDVINHLIEDAILKLSSDEMLKRADWRDKLVDLKLTIEEYKGPHKYINQLKSLEPYAWDIHYRRQYKGETEDIYLELREKADQMDEEELFDHASALYERAQVDYKSGIISRELYQEISDYYQSLGGDIEWVI